MNPEQRMALFKNVFSPKVGETALMVVDTPTDAYPDTPEWEARHRMSDAWHVAFEELGLNVVSESYPATGSHGAAIPDYALARAEGSNIVVALTQFSATAPLGKVVMRPGSTTRGASMPMATRGMEDGVLLADYGKVGEAARQIKPYLDEAWFGDVLFSTGHELTLDLRGRLATADDADYTKPGSWGNLSGGETFLPPYEGVEADVADLGLSKTQGVMPIFYSNGVVPDAKGKKLVLFHIRANQILDFEGDAALVDKLNTYFSENPTRRNIAELGIGCNPLARPDAPILESEKAEGIHIAYGRNDHFAGGKVMSDVHQDVVYSFGSPIKASLVLTDGKGGIASFIVDSKLTRFMG